MGGTITNYPDDFGTDRPILLLIKIFLNGVISALQAQFMSIYHANFYFMTILKWPKFAKIKISDILEEMIKELNLQEKTSPNG